VKKFQTILPQWWLGANRGRGTGQGDIYERESLQLCEPRSDRLFQRAYRDQWRQVYCRPAPDPEQRNQNSSIGGWISFQMGWGPAGNDVGLKCMRVQIFFLLGLVFMPLQCRPSSSNHMYMRFVAARNAQKSSDLFAELRLSLPNKTNVPLRLPYFLPDSVDASAPDVHLYAILEAADKGEYYIQLAWTSDCEGGNSCHYGSIIGSAAIIPGPHRKRIPVQLSGGVTGYYIPFTCGAHCDDSSLVWSERGFHYSISIKAGSLKNT
jgi:hypothetical protein